MMRKLMIAAAALLVLVACDSAITGVTIPEPAVAAGAWSGTARWDALQGGAPSSVSSASATATIFQNGAAVTAGSVFDVTGIYTGTIAGAIDDAGNFTGTATITALGPLCVASAAFGGRVEGNGLRITASFSDPGSSPCASAPIGLVLELSR
jgi:hypothetical protein